MSTTTVRLDMRGFRDLAAVREKLAKYYARVGVLGDKTKRKGNDQGTNALIGAVQEFGSASKGIPERSFLRAPLQTKLGKAVSNPRSTVVHALKKGDADTALYELGRTAAGIVAGAFDTANDGKWPANAPSTIAAKGSPQPLVDSGELRQSISFDVVGAKT